MLLLWACLILNVLTLCLGQGSLPREKKHPSLIQGWPELPLQKKCSNLDKSWQCEHYCYCDIILRLFSFSHTTNSNALILFKNCPAGNWVLFPAKTTLRFSFCRVPWNANVLLTFVLLIQLTTSSHVHAESRFYYPVQVHSTQIKYSYYTKVVFFLNFLILLLASTQKFIIHIILKTAFKSNINI